MEKKHIKCSGLVFDGSNWCYCGRNGITKDGYCKIHDPKIQRSQKMVFLNRLKRESLIKKKFLVKEELERKEMEHKASCFDELVESLNNIVEIYKAKV